ncbi:MAG: C40 family peptidase [Fimbriimonas sp.]
MARRVLRGAIALVTVTLCGFLWAAPRKVTLGTVRGSTMRLEGSHLLVGTREGSLLTFDTRTQRHVGTAEGVDKRPVVDAVSLEGQSYWAAEGSCRLNVPGGAVDLASAGLGSPIRRLGTWQGRVVVHGDSRALFVEPASHRVLTAREALPPDVAAIVEQGPMTASWRDGAGLMVSVRRYGRRERAEVEGGVRDIAMLTAWSFGRDGSHRLLGAYCTSLFEFHDAEGPRVRIKVGDRQIDNPYGTADIRNLRVGPEGVIALTKEGALAIPFYRDNWMPNHVKTEVAPSYAPRTDYTGSALWWSEGNRVVQASLEDGEADVYYPLRRQGQILDIAADSAGAFALTETGVVRIRPDANVPAKGYLRVNVAEEATPTSLTGRRLATALEKVAQLTPAQLQRIGSPSGMHRYLKSQRVRVRPQALRDEIGELRFGDLVQRQDLMSVYVGRDQLLTIYPDGPRHEPLALHEDTRLLRIVDPYAAISAEQFRAGGRNLLTGLINLGVGRANPALGHDMYVSWDPNSPLDGPSTPLQQQLAGMMEEWLGVPYRWGGSTLDGTDCSGLVTSLFSQLGIALPRHSQDIGRAAVGEVVYDQLRFGDVLVFPRPKHVAIYVGGGRVIEAISGGVQYSTLKRFDRAIVRRFILDTSSR